jgi:hypothetical protein
MEYKILAIVLVTTLLEGVHATLVQDIRNSMPDLLKRLGRAGPGYYVFGLFWYLPTYRKFLTSRAFEAELSGHPKLLALANVEFLLWYAMWATLILVVLL